MAGLGWAGLGWTTVFGRFCLDGWMGYENKGSDVIRVVSHVHDAPGDMVVYAWVKINLVSCFATITGLCG